MVKKTLTLVLAILMVGAMVLGCGGNNDPQTSSPAPSASGGSAPATSAGGEEPAPSASTGGGSSTGSADNVLNVSFATNPETCDPQKNSSVDGAVYTVHRFEGLYRYKWDGTGVEPGVAESYEVSDDGLVWTFKLRADAKWSDGQAVTAGDFEYTLKRLVNPETGAPYAEDMGHYMKNATAIMTKEDALYGKVDELGVKAIDETTLEITLENPTPYFEEIVAFPVYYPVRQDIVEANPDSWWAEPTGVSNGAFAIESFTMDEKLTLIPNEYYWDVANVVPKTINFWFMERDAITAAFKAGELDYGDHALVEEADALRNEGVYELRDQLGTYYLSFQQTQAPFDNPLVRKAFYYALDVNYMSETTINGVYSPTEAYVGPGFNDISGDFREKGGSYKDNANMEENKKIAQDALAEAGYPNGEGFPAVEYMYNNDTLHEAIAQVMQQQWKEVLNVDVTLVNQEWGVFTETRRKGNYMFARNGWIADYNDPSTMLNIFMSESGNNDGKYSNAKFDEAMTKAFAKAERDEEYYALLHEAEDILMEDVGCAPLFIYSSDMLVSKELSDWGYTPLGYKFFHKTTMSSW